MIYHTVITICSTSIINLYVDILGYKTIKFHVESINRKGEKCIFQGVLQGEIDQIANNQYGEKIKWELVKDFPEIFGCQNYIKFSNVGIIQDINDGIANAAIWSFNDKLFSRRAKKLLVNIWTDGVNEIRFKPDNAFTASIINSNFPLMGLSTSGTWNISNNMLFMMNGTTGLRTMINDISLNELHFPGSNGQLNYVMKIAQQGDAPETGSNE